MTTKHKRILISLATTSLLLVGCGSNNDTTIDTTKTAYLIDSAVEGINYSCGTLTGTTDSNGTFTYDTTKCPNGVEFKIGTLSLGTINPSNINIDKYLTIQELAGKTRNDITDENVTKLAVLLQSLDDDNNATNGILITQNIKNAITLDGNLSDKSDTEISSEITARGKTEKDVHTALAHLLDFTKSKDADITAVIAPTDSPEFLGVTGLELNASASSNTITISGLTIPTYITISSGSEYSVNGGTWKSIKSLVRNDDNVTVRNTTANTLDAVTITTIKVGGREGKFRSFTKDISVTRANDILTVITSGGINLLIEDDATVLSRADANVANATAVCSNLNLNGITSWRLPTYNELDYAYALRDRFLYTDGSGYWTSDESSPGFNYFRAFVNGNVSTYSVNNTMKYRCVKSGN
jgi:hypothetical protein